MFDDPITIIGAIGALVVAGILIFGLGTFAKGGEFSQKNSNKIMRWRLIAQFIVVVLVAGLVWLTSKG